MSNLVLPSLAQPRIIGWGWPVKKTPSYSTIVQTPASRRKEIRVSLTPNPIWNFEVDLSYIYGDMNQTSSTGIQILLDFYERMQGSADSWLYLDPYDNTDSSLVGYGDGATTQFQLIRTLNSLGTEIVQNPQYITAMLINNLSVAAMQNPVPANPALAQVTLGALGALTNFIKTTWILTSGESLPSAEVSLATSANKVVQVTQPANPPVDAIGWNVYGSTTTGTEVLQTPVYLPVATTTWTEAATGMVAGTRVVPTAANNWQLGMENLFLNSQDFSASSWHTVDVTVTSNTNVAPDGTTTADKLARSNNLGTYAIEPAQNIFLSSGDQVTFSCWVLQGTAGVKASIAISFENSVGVEIAPRLAGSVITLSSTWQRISITGTVPLGAAFLSPAIFLNNTSSIGDNIIVWGAQLERGTIPTGYLTTTTATARPNGLITFASAPATSAPINVNFSFYYRCRFLDDEWTDLEEFIYQIWELKSLKFKSILL